MSAAPPTPPAVGLDGQPGYILRVGMTVQSPQQNIYKVTDYLGHGVFGQVYKVMDIKTQGQYALKIGLIQRGIKSQFSKEVQIYNHLDTNCNEQEKKYISCLREHFNDNTYFVLVSELYRESMYTFLKSIDFYGMSLYHVQAAIRGIVAGVSTLHEQGIIHADLKPENVMFTDNSQIRIIDLGAAIFENFDDIPEYCQSRHYRAPEVILNLQKTQEIDIWSIGCIAAEFFTGLPIFAGLSELNMLQLMELRLGHFPIEMIKSSPRAFEFFNNDIVKKDGPVKDQCHFQYTTLEYIVMYRELYVEEKNVQAAFVDFLKNALQMDPDIRYTIHQLQDHPFLHMEIPLPSLRDQ